MNKGTPADKAKGGTVQGEGDYEAGRRFDQAQQTFVESGKADQQAGKARPRDASEAAGMEQAEQEGKSHSKGEAPADMRPKNKQQPK